MRFRRDDGWADALPADQALAVAAVVVFIAVTIAPGSKDVPAVPPLAVEGLEVALVVQFRQQLLERFDPSQFPPQVGLVAFVRSVQTQVFDAVQVFPQVEVVRAVLNLLLSAIQVAVQVAAAAADDW